MKSVIVIDSCSDLPFSYVNENDVEIVNFSYIIKGKDYLDDFGRTMPYSEFYSEVRVGEEVTTAQVNVFQYEQVFRRALNKGKDIVYICFSSALSGSYTNAEIARKSLLEQFPQATIQIIDSKSASMGEGLLCYYIIEMAKKGATGKEIVEWEKENVMRINGYFTVCDLNHLKRGGRISGTAAYIGTMLNIKPILMIDREGKLKLVDRVNGRRKSLHTLADYFSEKVENPEGQVVAISHADCEEDAFYVEKLIRKEYNVDKVIINNVGPVIGSHTGPNTVGIFFMGKERE